MRRGKLPPELLARLLAGILIRDPRVRVGPQSGEDAAVLDLCGQSLIVTTDPITFVSARAAWYAVQVNANDVAAMGGEPSWLAATVLLPTDVEEAGVEELFSQMTAACDELGVALITGHTEVTPAVNHPVVVGTMLGLTDPSGAITSAGAKSGDAVLLAGPIGVEGTAILADEAEAALRTAGVDSRTLASASRFLEDPGISVVRASRIIRALTHPHALHDATEGGVATALREVSLASGTGMVVDPEAIPVRIETATIAAALGLDPLGLISSGCLVAVVKQSRSDDVVDALRSEGIAAAVVGEVTEGSGLFLKTPGVIRPLPAFDRDELARYFDDLV